MNWGELDHFPMWSEVWGNVAEWTGGLFTALAAFIALGVYWLGKRADRRAQASLVSVEKGGGAYVHVRNQSDKAIVDLRVTAKIMSLWTAARLGDFEETVIIGSPQVGQYPSHTYYLNSRLIIKRMRGQVQTLHVTPEVREVGGGQLSGEILIAGLMSGGVLFYVHFRDAKGVEWSIDVLTDKLRMVKVRWYRRLWLWFCGHAWSAWWVGKNQWTYFWRRYLHHPKGRAKSLKELEAEQNKPR